MPVDQNVIAELVRLFSEFERKKFESNGRHALGLALTRAEETLLNPSHSVIHERIRSLIAMWFERVINWRSLALERHPHNYEILKLQAGNLELFNDPLFRLPTGYFDDEGYGEMLALIVEKPSKAWTSLEQRRINDFFQRIRDRSANKRGQRWGYLTTPFERAIAPRLGTARASNLPETACSQYRVLRTPYYVLRRHLHRS